LLRSRSFCGIRCPFTRTRIRSSGGDIGVVPEAAGEDGGNRTPGTSQETATIHGRILCRVFKYLFETKIVLRDTHGGIPPPIPLPYLISTFVAEYQQQLPISPMDGTTRYRITPPERRK
jgi:hypothetical protein